MIINKMKKVLSSILIAVYLIFHAASAGICISTSLPNNLPGNTPAINAGIQKPILRNTTNPSSLKLEGDITLSKSNPKISLSLRDSDVRQVLRMFADKAGLNIIFHDSVTGKVTLDLVNVPLNDAFKMILQVTGLTYYVDCNTMVVISDTVASSLNLAKQEMTTIPVKYVDAAVLADFLNKNIFLMNRPGLSNTQVAITNPITNDILIFGTKNDYLMAKKVVAQFDVKPLEETFVVNHTTPKEMATLLCNLLFSENKSTSTGGITNSAGGFSGSSSSSSSSNSSSNSTNNNPGNTSSSSGNPSTSPSPPNLSVPSSLPGKATGGASSITSSNSSDPSANAMSLGTGIIACQYNSAVTAGTLTSLSASNLSITYFPQRGTISVIGGSSQQMQLVKDFILKNDKKEPQAYLEVSIIELNESGSREFNNTWKLWSEFFSAGFDGKTASNSLYPTFLQGDFNPDSLKSGVPTIAKYAGTPTLYYTMDYLIKNGKGRTLANPRIMITNGQKSTIDLSADYVKSVVSQVVTNSVSGTPTVQYTYNIGSDEGIKVELTPFISPDGYVTLNITPNYSTKKGDITAYNQQTNTTDIVGTLLQRRNLDLKNVRIKDGETLVIGGMIVEDEQKNVEKLPVLGDLPGIGIFFRNTTSTKSKDELVIMLTPKIIKDSEDLVNNTDITL